MTTFFPIKTSSECDEKSLFNEMIKIFQDGSKEFNFKVVHKLSDDGWILEPIDPNNNKNVIDELVKSKKAQRVDVVELQQILASKAGSESLKEVLKTEKIREHGKPRDQAPHKEQAKKERKSPEKPKKVEKFSEKKSEMQLEVNISSQPKAVKENQNKQIIQEEPVMVKEEPVPVPVVVNDRQIAVKMTALTSPTDFYVSRVDEMENFCKLHSEIQTLAATEPSLEDCEEGTFCLAQQPFDLCWYRAKIIDSDETDQNAMITVRCIDDGKTFSVDEKSNLKSQPEAVKRMKFYGIACSLPIKTERKTEEAATDLMMSMMDSELQGLFINDISIENTNFVELSKCNENIVDLLVEKNLATRLLMIEPGKGYTSHINSLSSFYLQFEMDQLKLDLISQYFEESSGKFEKVEAAPGEIVAALFPEDGSWYRSKIDAVEADGNLVSFIDYGNSCIVKDIGKIVEAAMKDFPAMSKHCRLSKPKSIDYFSDEAEKKFIDICANGATILDVRSLKPFKAGEPAEVELFVDGKNIIDDLLALCQSDTGKLNLTIESNGSV